jgi:hypothetical protein
MDVTGKCPGKRVMLWMGVMIHNTGGGSIDVQGTVRCLRAGHETGHSLAGLRRWESFWDLNPWGNDEGRRRKISRRR